ncbi:response regulator [Candidatus Ferrigenium straubiae]|jgi:two-component system response regulator|uniref:response regulator n=1 Tax=Candidatus Ferrigenium straubiae TaxID=2919506 RepID=UPI003F4AC407
MKSDKRTILLVEDNPDDEELMRLAFKECKFAYELVVARDGQDALDFLFAAGKYSGRDACDMPQLVLLDLKLPKVNGLEVLKRIRADERSRFLPVVVLTSSREEQDLIDSYSLGANSYIQKPVDFNRFIDAVCQLGLYWLVWNEAVNTCRR